MLFSTCNIQSSIHFTYDGLKNLAETIAKQRKMRTKFIVLGLKQRRKLWTAWAFLDIK